MTSWVMWEIWWSRGWGEAEMDVRAGEHEPEVAHEPARLPAELIAHRSKVSVSRPRG
ncbi:hypothetical protein [Aeromonas hydrophila]|uniref:hypothetical protein n=1 Tax=Aeromonas hydrophila TaxID=644 RepID=UPI00191EB31B|nr:hypothetical protein [Aeromonas hydrophila]MBL0560236.1 hypothetical protein [Aeromonas hydrophila]